MKISLRNLFMRGSLKEVVEERVAAQQCGVTCDSPSFRLSVVEFLARAGSTMPNFLESVTVLENDNSLSSDRHLSLFENEDAASFRFVRTANLLATSSAGPRRIVTNSREALPKVGFPKVREIAAAAIVGKLFTYNDISGAYPDTELWAHSVGTAIAARRIYHHLFGATATGSLPYFLAGLLHDIGIAAEHQTLEAVYEFREMLTARAQDGLPLDCEETNYMGFNHAELGAVILQHWNLAPELSEAVLCHHRMPESRQLDGDAARITHCLRVADAMAHDLAENPHDTNDIDMEELQKSLSYLELTTDVAAEISAGVAAELNTLSHAGWLQLLRPRAAACAA